jgi:hypothetical protein
VGRGLEAAAIGLSQGLYLGGPTVVDGTFIGSHKYQLINYVEAYTYSLAGYYEYPSFQPGGPFSAIASASVNVASGGEHATLTSVKLV